MKVDWNKPLEMVLYEGLPKPCVKRGILDDGKVVVNLEGTPNSLWMMNPDGSCAVGSGARVQNAPPPKVIKVITVYTAVFQSKYGRIYSVSFCDKPRFVREINDRKREGSKFLFETEMVRTVEVEEKTS